MIMSFIKMRTLVRYCVSTLPKIIIVIAVILLQPVLGANPSQIKNSDNDLVRAIETVIRSGFITTDVSHYIPGYGLHLVFEKINGVPELNDATEQISTALIETGDTVKGLADGEWLSILFRGNGVNNTYDLIVRMKQGKPDTLEVYVDGLPGD